MKIAHTLLAMPLLGACAVAILLWESLPFEAPIGLALAAILHLGPFGFAFHMTMQGAQRGRLARLMVGVCFAVLLGYLPLTLLINRVDGEGLQYLLALYPVYSWSVVAIMTLIGIGADAIVNRMSRSTSNISLDADTQRQNAASSQLPRFEQL